MTGGKVKCVLCPFNCVLAEGKTGICGGKQNIGGELVAINYGLTTSLSLDPIEKKPLYHFLPGSGILSIGPNGCNMACNFCQNYGVSQEIASVQFIAPEKAVSIAVSSGSIGVAYTYAEPLIWFEYVLATSKAMRAKALKNVLVTNGFINPAPLEELLPWIDAMNIDIKSMDPAFYKKICKAKLEPALETLRHAARETHVEVTNLVIPGLNDSDENFIKLADFLAEINPLIPLHFSRYHPDYLQSAKPTPIKTLTRAADIASKKLKHVYIGNVPGEERNQTHCAECGMVIIERSGYKVLNINVPDGNCGFCGAKNEIIVK
ncbi:COG1180: Radical SAM, Pyruvate-formate lyase-activating enzyme like [hydrothermal vent metagenome]|uniref:COG1180: Radical SAM, Pyruvate-formate lyase-activating enzyme like n=1 Tax=hydrothermal vent metagenome TaxID=652676 RepID=A0A3B1BLV7_9ZZZZ